MDNRYFYWIILILLFGCKLTPEDGQSYQAWLSDPDNELNKVKQTEVFELSVQYLPTTYRVWQEMQKHPQWTETQQDSIYKVMEKSLYFIFTIAPREDKASGDVMYSGIQEKSDLEQRVNALNFGMSNYWQLKTSQGEYAPVLTNLENTYSLTDFRKLHLVFAPADTTIHFQEVPQWDLVFNDEVFGTGIHHFVFFQGDWKEVQELD